MPQVIVWISSHGTRPMCHLTGGGYVAQCEQRVWVWAPSYLSPRMRPCKCARFTHHGHAVLCGCYPSIPSTLQVNIFSGKSLASSSCITSFVDAATAVGAPVMLGESTPRGYTVLDDAWSTVHPVSSSGPTPPPYLSVSEDSTKDGAGMVMVSDEKHTTTPSTASLWRINPDGFLINNDGKCVGTNGTRADPAGAAVITECGGRDPGPVVLHWVLEADGRLMAANGTACLVRTPGGVGEGAVNVASGADCATATTGARWHVVDSGVGGGNASWHGWFEPYLDLIANPTVQAFCYIDWFWPAFSNHEGFNWYNWGDARLEHSTIVGQRWANALAARPIIGAASSGSDLCTLLNCTIS
eukprot:m.18960 g.18960  ORF g.18960 m.18960 type:complete len:356 (-) comp3646_c0_seq1:147-1214(-)